MIAARLLAESSRHLGFGIDACSATVMASTGARVCAAGSTCTQRHMRSTVCHSSSSPRPTVSFRLFGVFLSLGRASSSVVVNLGTAAAVVAASQGGTVWDSYAVRGVDGSRLGNFFGRPPRSMWTMSTESW